MDSETPPRGFTFPGTFEVTAFGLATADLETVVVGELIAAGVRPDPDSVRRRASSAGRWLAVEVRFWCEDRPHYDAAYARLRAHPSVKWTL